MFIKTLLFLAFLVSNMSFAGNELFIALEPTDGMTVLKPSRTIEFTLMIPDAMQKTKTYTLNSLQGENTKKLAFPDGAPAEVNLLINGTVSGKLANSTCTVTKKVSTLKPNQRLMVWLRGGSSLSFQPTTCSIQIEELKK